MSKTGMDAWAGRGVPGYLHMGVGLGQAMQLTFKSNHPEDMKKTSTLAEKASAYRGEIPSCDTDELDGAHSVFFNERGIPSE
jgi:hypothetical protein